jgi:hypothetical protein
MSFGYWPLRVLSWFLKFDAGSGETDDSESPGLQHVACCHAVLVTGGTLRSRW